MDDNGSWALYRLPDATEAFLVRQRVGEARRLQSLADLEGRSGYVVAPFVPTSACPLLLIEGEREAIVPTASGPGASCPSLPALHDDREEYATDFQRFHDVLVQGTFQKLVLARAAECDADVDAPTLFWRACRRFPHQFVSLVHTPLTGTWLMATPELLLSHCGDRWQTMSLAGTMPLADRDQPWSAKNRQEQRFVTDYIRQTVEPLATDLRLDGPRTAQAGNVVHLRTDVTFRLRQGVRATDLLARLFPTPAVCGIEKTAARQFILTHEHLERRYYSGFSGPISAQGATQLFVTLRCMELLPGRCRLYAGSGLLVESTEDDEYRETTAKMVAMQSLLGGDRNEYL